jgi:hypothetical protein
MLKAGACILALIAMGTETQAAVLCDLGSASALKTAAVQQEMMVAGFTCNATTQYNRFVIDNQTDLQTSDAALMNYFRTRDGTEAGYDSYKTKLANLSASRSAADTGRYCASIAGDFAAARGQSLSDFVASRHLLIATPEACAVKYDMPEVAVAGPSYALPATPYGAAPAQVAVSSPRQVASAPPPARYQRNGYDGYSYYGPPPGWLPPPPRPVRRWDWYARGPYGGYYYNN